MLSARELNSASLPNRSWINERLQYTHGFGVAMGPVNEVTQEGLPVEGNVGGAEEVLLTALALDPELARTRFFLALALKGQGRYDEALAHLEHAARSYPLDRVVRNQIGRLLFLQRQFAEAVESFEQVLAIDPEDLTAHYNLMLSYRGLDEPELAARERQLYERFKADESAQAITGPYRQLNPDDNNERQPIHEHRGTPRADAGGLSDPGSSVVPSRTR